MCPAITSHAPTGPNPSAAGCLAFGAQATVGAGFGYLGQVADQRLSARLAYHLYHHGALRLGHEAAYPLWLGSRYLFRTGVPAGLGVTEEHLENQAQDRWPVPDPASAPDTLRQLPPIR